MEKLHMDAMYTRSCDRVTLYADDLIEELRTLIERCRANKAKVQASGDVDSTALIFAGDMGARFSRLTAAMARHDLLQELAGNLPTPNRG